MNKDLRQPGLSPYPVNVLLALFNAGKNCDLLHVDEVVQPELHSIVESNDVIPAVLGYPHNEVGAPVNSIQFIECHTR